MQGFCVFKLIKKMDKLYLSHVKLISIHLAKKISIIVFSIFIFETLLFPIPTLANYQETEVLYNQNKVINNHLPKNTDREYSIEFTKYITVTAYNSEFGQTDDTPCITANGFDVCEHGIEDTIAANFLRLGTKIRIPELFDNRIFVVRDRMNARYTDRVDIWMINKEDALKLGKRLAKIEVLE